MSERTKLEFVEKVEYYNVATFGELPLINSTKKKPLPIYAAYLYDSVMLYAKALANVTSTKNVNGELILSSTL